MDFMKKEFAKYQEIAMRVLALFGLVAILALGSFSTITLVKYFPKLGGYVASAAVSLSSVFVSAEKLTVAVSSSDIDSGKTVVLSWNHLEKSGDGSYTINYPCTPGVEVKITRVVTLGQMFCNTPFPIMESDKELSLAINSTKNRYVDVPFSVHFTRNGRTMPSLSETATVTVTNTAVPDSASYLDTKKKEDKKDAQAPSPLIETITGAKTPIVIETPAKKKVSIVVPSAAPLANSVPGKPDLKPTIIETGFLDPVTNVFTASPTVRLGQRPAVRFSVANLGTGDSPAWSFNAIIPTFPISTFHSDSQPALKSGDRIEFTMGFDGIYEDGDRTVTINVDPTGSISEASETNNIAKVTFTVVK